MAFSGVVIADAPHAPFFLPRRLRRRTKKKKEFFGDTPITCPPDRVPAKGWLPLGTPLWIRSALLSISIPKGAVKHKKHFGFPIGHEAKILWKICSKSS